MIEQMFSLKGRAGLITGGGTGIARVVALKLAEAGAKLLVADLDPDLAEDVAAEIRKAGGDAQACGTDVRDQTAVEAMFARAGPNLDFVVPGQTLIGGRPLLEMTVEQWDDMQATNLRGAFLTSRAAVRVLSKRPQGGRIAAISTVGSMHAVISGNEAYGASKAGLNALMRNIAFDHAKDGVRANAIVVGPMVNAAPRIAGAIQGEGPGRTDARMPLGRGAPEDVGALAVFLVGPSGGHVTGQALVIDGGFLIS